MVAALVMLAGCGGGGAGGSQTTTAAQPAPSTTTSSESSSFELSQTIETTTSTSSSSNEQQSGDEVPISTQALFTGRGGRISPSKVQVPPFIAVTVVLRSADGKSYGVAVRNHGVITNGRAEMKLSGLRAGDRYVLKTEGATPSRVIIEATAEPGP